MAASCEGLRACRSCSKGRRLAQRRLFSVPQDRRGARWRRTLIRSIDRCAIPRSPIKVQESKYPTSYTRAPQTERVAPFVVTKNAHTVSGNGKESHSIVFVAPSERLGRDDLARGR